MKDGLRRIAETVERRRLVITTNAVVSPTPPVQVLGTGEILVAGGFITVPKRPYAIIETVDSAEFWDPSTQTWTGTWESEYFARR